MPSLAGGVVHDASTLLLILTNSSISLNKNQKTAGCFKHPIMPLSYRFF